MDEYDDEYRTCEQAYASFRVYHDNLDPAAVTRDLGIQPSDVVEGWAWILSTEAAVSSRDIRRHLDWLIDQLEPRHEVIRSLQSAGCRMDVFCYWRWTGQGGPTISPRNMHGLGLLGIELGFDIYHSWLDESQEET
jgi:hypothetical protein